MSGSVIVKDFNLEYTVESGQIFRYIIQDGGYHIIKGKTMFFVKQEKDRLFYKNIEKSELLEFLGVNVDYKKIIKDISKDPHIKKSVDEFYGLRILKQDPWECLISFICSSAANIPKIRLNVNLLSEFLGKKIGENNYSFPEIGALKNQAILQKAKSGYRSRYLFETNKKVTKEFLDSIYYLNYSEAKQKLTTLPGVGDKVADCILLFAYQKYEAFPVDTWIYKGMCDLYFPKNKISYKDTATFARRKFGKYAGFAQQFLFHNMRTNG